MSTVIQSSIFDPVLEYFIFLNMDGSFEMRFPVGMLGVNQEAWRKYFAVAELEMQQGRPWAKLTGRFKDEVVTDYLIGKIREHKNQFK